MVYFNLSLAQFLPIPILNTDPTSFPSLHTDVQNLRKLPQIRGWRRASLPLLTLTVVVGCAFVMWRFQSPRPRISKKLVHAKKQTESLLPKLAAAAPLAPAVPVVENAVPTPAPLLKVEAPNAAPEVSAPVAQVESHPATPPPAEKMVPAPVEKKKKQVSHRVRKTIKKVVAPKKKVRTPKDDDDEDSDDSPMEEMVFDRLIETPELTAEAALEFTLPLETLILSDLSEDLYAVTVDTKPEMTAYVLNAKPERFPLEQRFLLHYGTIKKNEFVEIQDRLKAAKAAAVEFKVAGIPLPEPKPKPEPELVRKTMPTPAKTAPVLAKVSVPKPKPAEIKPVVPQVVVKTESTEAEDEPADIDDKPEVVTAATAGSTDLPSTEVGPVLVVPQKKTADSMMAAPQSPAVATQGAGNSLTTQPKLSPPASPMTIQPPPVVVAKKARKPSPSFSVPDNVLRKQDRTEGDTLYGKLEIDEEARAAISKRVKTNKWHIQLVLQPFKSRDVQDRIYLDYQFPSNRFQVDTRRLKIQYRLIARVFVPNEKETDAVAQIVCLDRDRKKLPIWYQTHDNPYFEITEKDVVTAFSEAGTSMEQVVLTLSLFEGARGNFQDMTPIPGGKIWIQGFEDLKIEPTDKDGDVRITGIPTSSEVIVRAEAPGFYPTRRALPIAGRNASFRIYLIKKEKVESITKYFTKRPQKDGFGIIMGRAFDENWRDSADTLVAEPKSDVLVSLAFRLGKALYFDAFPDTWLSATTKVGLFGFFNVMSNFRFIRRDDAGTKKPSYLVNVLPDHAYYVEFGRGGKKDFKGNLVDPYNSGPVNGRIRLLGDEDESMSVYTDDNGGFTFRDLDFEPGALTFEVEASGYPTSWFTVPWNVSEPLRVKNFYMVQREVFRETATGVAKLTPRRDLGSIIGGAEQSFFKGRTGCVRVAAFNTNDPTGKPVPAENGPFPFSKKRQETKSLCLRAANPGFGFYNLESGEYIIKLVGDEGEVAPSHVARVGKGKVSIAVN